VSFRPGDDSGGVPHFFEPYGSAGHLHAFDFMGFSVSLDAKHLLFSTTISTILLIEEMC